MPRTMPQPITTQQAVTPNPNAELLELATNPATPRWLVDLIPTLLDKDPLDVSVAFDCMAGVTSRRMDAYLVIAQQNVTITEECDGCHSQQGDVQTVTLRVPWGEKARYCPSCRGYWHGTYTEVENPRD